MKNHNAVQFDPAAGRDHVESYFIKLNERSGDRALWLKATIFASALEPSRPVAEGWAIAFDRRGGSPRHVAVKHSLPYSSASFGDRDLAVAWTIPPAGRPIDPDAAAKADVSPADPDRLSLTGGEEGGATSGAISLREHR